MIGKCKELCTACKEGFQNYCYGSMGCKCSKPGWTSAEIEAFMELQSNS